MKKLGLLILALLLLPLLPSPAFAQSVTPRTAKGKLYVIIIPVEFSDFAHTVTVLTLNETAAAMGRYYAQASFGQALVQPRVLPTWLTLNHPMSYYGADKAVGDDAGGNPNGSEQLVLDAVSAAEATTSLTLYQYVIVVHAGADQATASPTERSPLIWSRTWIGKTFLPVGSDAASIVSEFSPYGIWSHEFGHQTGHLPDMYDLPDSSLHFVGTWSLMDIGAYLGQPVGTSPGLLDAWSRVSLGWITPTIARNGDFSLIPAETPSSETAKVCCYALEVPIDSSSYFLVELRLKQGLDVAQKTQGVVIYKYNGSAAAGRLRVIDIHINSTPARGDLSDAVFGIEQTFSDPEHSIFISVTAVSSSSYTVHVSSRVTYSISVVLPNSFNVLTTQKFYVLLNPPINGLNLKVFLDGPDQAIGTSNTTSSQRYNFTMYLQPLQQGSHHLTAALTDSAGRTLASSSAEFTASVPLWVALIQPLAVYVYIIAGVFIILLTSVASARREKLAEVHSPST